MKEDELRAIKLIGMQLQTGHFFLTSISSSSQSSRYQDEKNKYLYIMSVTMDCYHHKQYSSANSFITVSFLIDIFSFI